MFINNKLLLFILSLASILLIIIIPNFYVRVLLIGFLAYGYFLYAKQKGYNGILGIVLFVVLNVVGLIILFILPDKNLKANNQIFARKQLVKLYKLNRLKFYLFLLAITIGLCFLGFLLLISFRGSCEGMECLALAPLIIALSIIILAVIIIVNLKLFISYERINRDNKKNRFIILIYILLIFAGLSYSTTGDIFFINNLIINPIKKHRIEVRLKTYLENKDINACLEYTDVSSPHSLFNSYEKYYLTQCSNYNSFLCNYFSTSKSAEYFGYYSRYCYREILGLMHKELSIIETEALNDAELFCRSLDGDYLKGICNFHFLKPSMYIANREEMLSLCKQIKNPDQQLKCIKIYSKINREDGLPFCDLLANSKYEWERVKSEECLKILSRLIDL